MERKALEEIKKITERQEELLRFPHFSNKDALELGKFITDKIYERDMELAVAIRKINGAILYQHMTEGTCLNNQNWMMRKFRTVSLMERSSFGAWVVSNLSGETIPIHGLSETEYVFCGGGFPIGVKTGEMVAILTVSNLPHIEDHHFIIEVLSEWLGIENVPQIEISNYET